MKKLLFASYSLDLGGIETALVTLLNYLVQEYKITLVLEKKQGIFLNELDSRVEIIEYKACQSKNIIFRKIVNLLKRFKFILKHKNKYDFAGSFATYSIPASFCARMASKKSALWVHNNYLKMYNDENTVKEFFKSIKYTRFKTIICVSNEAKYEFKRMFTKYKGNVISCNNLIDYNKILEKSEEKIELIKKDNIITFLNVGRHDEHQKKLTRLIEVAKKLKKNKYSFRVFLVGSGQDTEIYESKIKKYNLEDTIFILGAKKNPYPYFKISDAVILTSDYEGYPVVFIESKILNKPIITTDVSDAKETIDGKYGIVTKTKSIEDIYIAMREFIENGYEIKEKFNPEEFNKEILSKLKKLF